MLKLKLNDLQTIPHKSENRYVKNIRSALNARNYFEIPKFIRKEDHLIYLLNKHDEKQIKFVLIEKKKTLYTPKRLK